MNVFETHQQIIAKYDQYIRSFVNIRDEGIRSQVEEELGQGKLWPEPLLQFNPSYEVAGAVKSLTGPGHLHPDLGDTFKDYFIYRHQAEAMELGMAGKDFVVTSGTGSGKSLTYMGTIFHHLLHQPEVEGVQAVIVYPLNALINSQTEELRRYRQNYEQATGRSFPITFGQYTGQEDETKREEMRKRPPHILLTNYMMLELLLTRLKERPIRDAIYRNLRHLVFDELHTYRGRQGADVALLIRRIRAQCARPITCMGTSATMVSGGSVREQRETVAAVAGTVFGRAFPAEQVVQETLVPSLDPTAPTPSLHELAAVLAGPIDPAGSEVALAQHPLARWLEREVALERQDDVYIRRRPQRVGDLVALLSTRSGVQAEACSRRLAEMLHWISQVNQRLRAQGVRRSLLPYKLHQFIAQTGSVYTTLEQDASRFVTLEPGLYKPDAEGSQPIFANVFSRASGHAFLCAVREGDRLAPREFQDLSALDDEDEDAKDKVGYLIVGDDVWDEEADLDLLPETWFRTTRQGRTLNKEFRHRLPRKIWFDRMGRCSDKEGLEFRGWWMPQPLLFDPTAGIIFDRRSKEGTKLTKLGSEGRSTSTTILSFLIIAQLRDAGVAMQDQKLLSFTDNRQDAALQAGHFNDFIQVVRLRAALHKALQEAEGHTLDFAHIGSAVFNALGLSITEFTTLEEAPPLESQRRELEEVFRSFLVYRVLGDLKRSWRIVLPNLEQCALLEIGYRDLAELAAHPSYWDGVPLLENLDLPRRQRFLETVLDFFRLEFAIHSATWFDMDTMRAHQQRFREKLRAPWTLDRGEELRAPGVVRYEPLADTSALSSTSMGTSSGLAKFVRHFAQQEDLDTDRVKGEANYRAFITQLMEKLATADMLERVRVKAKGNQDATAYRLKIDQLAWRLGDGHTVKPDLIKRRSYKDTGIRANAFFKNLYISDLDFGKALKAEDHTGQLDAETRKERERQFRADYRLEDGQTPDMDQVRKKAISALFCSPTMELGIDIGGLSVVHLRNAPPNAANYAQRSGRAGRSGQGALIFTYCSNYSAHDRHYFQEQAELVAGAVQAPRLDLCNQELLRTHLNALAVSEIGLPGLEDVEGRRASLTSFVDMDQKDKPLSDEVKAGLSLSPATRDHLLAAFTRVVRDLQEPLEQRAKAWYREDWPRRNLTRISLHLDQSLARWRSLHASATATLHKVGGRIQSGTLSAHSPEFRQLASTQKQATRQLNLLENNLGGRGTDLSEFYPFRYLAAEGFLPGYNFTRLPLRIFVPLGETTGDFISRPRRIALGEYGPRNILYHKGRKYRVEQVILQDAEQALVQAKVSTRAGYFLAGDQLQDDRCPFSGVLLADAGNTLHLTHLLEMSESRAVEVERITCEEEERARLGFDVKTYFTVEGPMDAVRKGRVLLDGEPLLNLRFIPAARLVYVNHRWNRSRQEGFPINLASGHWRDSMPDPEKKKGQAGEEGAERCLRVKAWTSDLADALYIEPVAPLGLDAEGVITLQYALKRAIETHFLVEPSEIGVQSMGPPSLPNIFLYEASEGSLGILSRFVEDPGTLRQVVEAARRICRYEDVEYKAKASYGDLLSYYNQAHHATIDRFLIQDALEKLAACTVETGSSEYQDYEAHYQVLLQAIDPTSQTERRFLDYLHQQGLRLPDAAQKRVPDIYVQPDFYYEPRFWVFCDGTPHDQPAVMERDRAQRQEIIARGDEVWVYHYRDDLTAKVAARPDIFRKVR